MMIRVFPMGIVCFTNCHFIANTRLTASIGIDHMSPKPHLDGYGSDVCEPDYRF